MIHLSVPALPHLPTLTLQSVAGCDEAGRGPLAGPVVAAAVILTPTIVRTSVFHYLRDSKKLTPTLRSRAAHQLIKYAHQPDPLLHYALSYISAATIDALNIRKASLLAMEKAVQSLPVRPRFVVVDGRDTLAKRASLALTRGDGCHLAVAAASILAKVARDVWMEALALGFPAYGFDRHKGYGTKAHLNAIVTHGPCPEHRMSFAPLSESIS